MAKLETAHESVLYFADMLEKGISLFTWEEPAISSVLVAALAGAGLAASALVAASSLVWGSLLRLGVRHAVFAAGAVCFLPQGAPYTRALLDALVTYVWVYIQMGAAVRLPTAGSGLVCTAPPPPRKLSDAEMALKAHAEAEASVRALLDARDAGRRARGLLRTPALSPADLLAPAWVGRLYARAPNKLEAEHRRMAKRALAGEQPTALAASASMLSSIPGAHLLGGGVNLIGGLSRKAASAVIPAALAGMPGASLAAAAMAVPESSAQPKEGEPTAAAAKADASSAATRAQELKARAQQVSPPKAKQ